MARDIDFSKALSEDELRYVNDRPWMRKDAELNGFTVQSEDDEFVVEETEPREVTNPAANPVGEVDSDEEEADDDYSEWTVEELKEELGKRDLTKAGSKPELIARLEADDQENGS